VALDDALADADRLRLLGHDNDPFNRWESGQRLGLDRLLRALDAGTLPAPDDAYLSAMRSVLRDESLEPALAALLLQLPGEAYIAEQVATVDPQRIHAVREHLLDQLAEHLLADWAWSFEHHAAVDKDAPPRLQAGRRAASGPALAMLCRHAVRTGNPVWPGRALRQVGDAATMTERLAALEALVDSRSELAENALLRFHALAHGDALVIDKWFRAQARASEQVAGSGSGGGVLARVKALMQHPDFTLRRPNRARSLIVAMCRDNPAAFHRHDAAGYVFWAERLIELDAINPSLAGDLARVMDRIGHLAEPYRSAAREAVARVAARNDLSDEVREIVGRALSGA
jgi:aminopeptidase N